MKVCQLFGVTSSRLHKFSENFGAWRGISKVRNRKIYRSDIFTSRFPFEKACLRVRQQRKYLLEE